MVNSLDLLILTAVLAITASSPAAASDRFAKSKAILGGDSALAAVLNAQQAEVRPEPVAPASPGLSDFRAAAHEKPAALPAAFSADRPNVFGSIALKISRTPLDTRWQRVARAPVTGAAASYARRLAKLDAQAKLKAVNRYVNSRVDFTDDSREFHRADVWTSASSTLARGRGDCEDYAIAKFQMLRTAGFAEEDLYLVILKDLVRRADHAVLVARTDGKMLVLDNGTDELFESSAIADYRPVVTFATNGAWTHGYRMGQAAMQVSQAQQPELAEAAFANADQRSRSASLLALSTGFSK